MAGRNGNYYGAKEETANLADVTSSPENEILLQRLRDDDPGLTYLGIGEYNTGENIFVVREGDHLGWLGYFLGRSTTLSKLNIMYLPQEKWRSLAFIRELVSNRSIEHLVLSTDLGEDGFQSLGTILKSDVLVTLEFDPYGLNNVDAIGLDWCGRKIASMLDQPNQCNHIKTILFEDISGEVVAEIAPALGAHPQLEKLDLGLYGPGGRHGSVALGSVLEGWENPQLRDLWLWQEEDFDGEGLHALVTGMRNCHNLTRLSLGGNSITANGCRLLSTLFHSDNFCLEHLHLNFDRYRAATIANGLDNYCSLKSLSLRVSSIDNDWLSTSIASLEVLNLARSMIDDDVARALAGGLANLPSLKELNLSHTSIGNEGVGALAAGLMHLRSLKELDLSFNPIGDEGISVLAPSLASLESLESLDFRRFFGPISIGDDGVQALVDGISHCSKLSRLSLTGNRSITTQGVVSLSELFRSDSCALTELRLDSIRLGDIGAAALADGLKGKKLIELFFRPNEAGLTLDGWSAFSKLLCDTSSVNNTYLSNHTLKIIGDWNNRGTPDDVKQLLVLNKHPDEHVAIHKILKSHADFDVEPFFKWDLKLLPFVLFWFERVITLVHVDDHKWISEESVEAIQSRKLSTMYKFVRDMPVLATFVAQLNAATKIQSFYRNRKHVNVESKVFRQLKSATIALQCRVRRDKAKGELFERKRKRLLVALVVEAAAQKIERERKRLLLGFVAEAAAQKARSKKLGKENLQYGVLASLVNWVMICVAVLRILNEFSAAAARWGGKNCSA